jgi:hypothetical protein
MEGKCTIAFEHPFWVGIFERLDERGYSAARFVFGAEPTEAELHRFALQDYQRLEFSLPGPAPERGGDPEPGFKRRLREARKTLQGPGAGTRAQQAIQAEYERRKDERQELSREACDAEEQRQFLLRQERKKEKHRGR